MTVSPVYLLLVLLLVYLFRRDIFAPASHRFYLFFAYQALLLLLFINLEHWSGQQSLIYQAASWIVLVVAPIFAVSAYYSLKEFGAPAGRWDETTKMVTQGIYHYIRHPLNSALIMLAAGIMLKDVSAQSASTCALAVLSLVLSSIIEERQNLAKFGNEYAEYQNRTRRFIPGLI